MTTLPQLETYQPRSKKALYWLDRCRELTGYAVKSADGGVGQNGPPSDRSFEAGMSALVHAIVAEKAPALVPFELGFQTISKDEDSGKCAAVIGYKIGQGDPTSNAGMIFLPAFFLKGQIKLCGLYEPSVDKFRNLDEEVVNALLRRQPRQLGKAVRPDLASLGVLPADLRSLNSPYSKFGSDRSWAIDAWTAMSRPPTHAPLTWVKTASQGLLEGLLAGLQQFPRYAEAFSKTAGMADLTASVARFQKRSDNILATNPVPPIQANEPPLNGAPAPGAGPDSLTGPPVGGPADGSAGDDSSPPYRGYGPQVVPHHPTFLTRTPEHMAAGTSAEPLLPPGHRYPFGDNAVRDLDSEARPSIRPTLGMDTGTSAETPAPLPTVNGYPQEQTAATWGQTIGDYANKAWDWTKRQSPVTQGAMLAAPFAAYGAYSLLNRKKQRRDVLGQPIEEKLAADASLRGPVGRFARRIPVRGPKSVNTPAGPGMFNDLDAPPPRSDLTFATKDASVLEKSAAIKEKLLNDGIVIEDNRDDHAIAYRVVTDLSISSPFESGCYDVLTVEGQFERCLVLLSPMSNRGRKHDKAVVIGKGDKHTCRPIVDITAKTEVSDKKEMAKWLADYPEAKPGSIKPSYSAEYVIVHPDGDSTAPFEVREKLDEDRVRVSYCHYYNEHSSHDDTNAYYNRLSHRKTHREPYYDYSDPEILFTDKPDAKLTTHGPTIYVPAGCKLIQLKPDTDREDERPQSRRRDNSRLELGRPDTIETLLVTKTAALMVGPTPTHPDAVKINGVDFEKLAALIHLVRDWELTEKQSRALLAESAAMPVRVRVMPPLAVLKTAEQTYPMQEGGPISPPFPPRQMGVEPLPGRGVPAYYPQEDRVPVADLRAQTESYTRRDRLLLPDRDALAMATQAASSGQQEVFDASSLTSALQASQDDETVDRHLPDLENAVDAVYRILFNFYWRGDQFQDRYGKKDMPELESLLRTAGESGGKLYMYLKQKTVDPYGPEDSAVDLSGSEF